MYIKLAATYGIYRDEYVRCVVEVVSNKNGKISAVLCSFYGSSCKRVLLLSKEGFFSLIPSAKKLLFVWN